MLIVRALVALVLLSATLTAQPTPAPPPQRPSFDTDSWRAPTDPVHIVGPIHYVGTKDLGVYLITTPAGHILLDGTLAESAPGIEASIRALGFKPEDIKILLISQAHFDHVASLAHMKRVSKARVEVMGGDDEVLESGGKKDYLFADVASAQFEPVAVDRVLKDGDTVTLGGVTMTAHHTPGHTPGTTTWTMTVVDGGRSYRVVFPGSTTVNPGTRLVGNPSYPAIADDFRRTFKTLEALPNDIFLAAHASFFDLAGKRKKAATAGPGAYSDPDGYVRLHREKKAVFEALVAKEQAAGPSR